MESEPHEPHTEAEVLDEVRRSKIGILYAWLVSGVVAVVVCWLFLPTTIAGLLTAVLVIGDLAGWVYVTRSMDRSAQERIAELRGDTPPTPREQLPDIGI
jgi:hypothetical protein